MPAKLKLGDLFCAKAAERHETLIPPKVRRYKNRTGSWPDWAGSGRDKMQLETCLLIRSMRINSSIRPTEEGFNFFSTGKDGVDDDGVNNKSLEADDVLFWPLKSQKTENKLLQKPLHLDANPS